MAPLSNDAREILRYVLVAAVLALVIVDIVMDGPQLGNLGVMVFVVILALLRPGRIRGR